MSEGIFNICLKESFMIARGSYLCSLYSRMLGRGLQLKLLISFFSIVLFFFEKLVNSRFVDQLMKRGFCLISSKVLSLLGQLQIFWQLQLKELPGLLIGLGLLELKHVIYPALSSGLFSHVGLFHKLKSYEISGQLFGLILFPVTDRFECFWMGSVRKNIQLMLVFFKALFLVLHFSCYTLMTFLMIIL